MSEFDEVVDLELLLNELKSKSDEESEMRAKSHEIQDALNQIARQHASLSRQMVQLKANLSVAERTKRELEKKVESAKRLKMLKDQAKELRDQFEEKTKELDELTKSAKWREFAFDHQIEGGKRLAVAKRGILGDKRGLGKTLTSLIWADMVQAKRILVLAPNDVVPQFESEIREWSPNRTIFPMRGLDKQTRAFTYQMLNMVEEFVVTLNYEAWRRDKTIIDDLVAAGIDTVICDEAHRIKSSSKQTAKGVFRIVYCPNYCSKCNVHENFMGPWRQNDGKLAEHYEGWQWKHSCGEQLTCTVQNFLAMTGTPLLNKPQELFSMLFCVDNFKFPTERKFLNDYCYKEGPNRWKFMSGGLKRLTDFMAEFFLQRTREDAGITLPPPAITVHRIEKDFTLYADQYQAERDIAHAAKMVLKNGVQKDIFVLLEILLRQRQCMTWPAGIKITDPDTKEVICHFDVTQSQKLDEATEFLKDLAEEGERVIVFSQFNAPLEEMHNRLARAGYTGVKAIGSTPARVLENIKQDFDIKTASKTDYKYQLLFSNYKKFGTGVNLNAARHIILLDYEWNPGSEDQAIGRIDRLNSVDQANVHIFHVEKSIDDFMEAILEDKRNIVGGFESASVQARLEKYLENFNE